MYEGALIPGLDPDRALRGLRVDSDFHATGSGAGRCRPQRERCAVFRLIPPRDLRDDPARWR